MKVQEAQHIYFLGIGGIGMSALAKYFHLKGKKISGYDRTSSIVTSSLESLGIEVHYTESPSHLDGVDYVIYTPAIPDHHLEWDTIKKKALPVKKRAAVLGELTRDMKAIAVAGTHGKTTTTSMITHLLKHGGMDITAFLGGIARNIDSNFLFGNSEWVVVEADEYDRSFMQLYPELLVFTALDPDHLDIYGTEEEMLNTYVAFTDQLSEGGKMWVAADIEKSFGKAEISYGIGKGIVRATDLNYEGMSTRFNWKYGQRKLENLQLFMPGHHNVSNMTVALAIAAELGIPNDKLKSGVAAFKGIYRRFELRYEGEQITYIDDYAHHPEEIKAAIHTAAQVYPERQLVVLFQPHLYTRTRDFYEGFAAALSAADYSLLLPIYPARELPIEGVDSEMITRQMKQSYRLLGDRKELLVGLEEVVEMPTVLLSLGAGDIDKETDNIAQWVKHKDKEQS